MDISEKQIKKFDHPQQLKIGILGGGQLGRMFALKAAEFGVHPYFLDKQTDFPSGLISQRFWVGDFQHGLDVYDFGKRMDIVSIEIENVNTQALTKLESEGVMVFPSSDTIALIKDKGTQKEFYKINNFPTSPYLLYQSKSEVLEAIHSGKVKAPFVQKSRTAGYDGKGVQVVRSHEELEALFDVPSVIESLVDIDKELAVTVARNPNGESETYPVVEMVFDPEANLVDYIKIPAAISEEHSLQCKKIALQLSEKLNLVGLLAIEFFLTKSGEILINEMAPRTHNSGHITMEACTTSQFEQQLRCLCNLSLGSTEYHFPAAMVNVLGPQDYTGPVNLPALNQIKKIPGAYIHLYGKQLSKPKRKLGHINIVGKTEEEVKSKLDKIKSLLP